MMASDRVIVLSSSHPRIRAGMIGMLIRLSTDGVTVYFDNAKNMADGEYTAQAIVKLPLNTIALIADHGHDN